MLKQMAKHVNINTLYATVNAEHIQWKISDSWWIITQEVVSINCLCEAQLHSIIFITNSRNVLEVVNSSFSSTALKSWRWSKCVIRVAGGKSLWAVPNNTEITSTGMPVTTDWLWSCTYSELTQESTHTWEADTEECIPKLQAHWQF